MISNRKMVFRYCLLCLFIFSAAKSEETPEVYQSKNCCFTQNLFNRYHYCDIRGIAVSRPGDKIVCYCRVCMSEELLGSTFVCSDDGNFYQTRVNNTELNYNCYACQPAKCSLPYTLYYDFAEGHESQLVSKCKSNPSMTYQLTCIANETNDDYCVDLTKTELCVWKIKANGGEPCLPHNATILQPEEPILGNWGLFIQFILVSIPFCSIVFWMYVNGNKMM
ncbi:uncharacterized protein LOC132195339 [Neocloeon triangulifer]|uniref:uncharacterized protein LOC132195339 n=1 Tax=Neocloeon triangulifer TaxID=2078957 RepID=UPI00286EE4B3|nr:uncharacterized protein LOC132195339 [Neocloeon triangulifer]